MKNFLSQLQWRHATKIFNPEKKIDSETVRKILESIQMTPSSLGLQPYKVLIIEDQKQKDELQTYSKNQPQIGTASHVLVFCRDTNVDETIKEYSKNALKAGVNPEDLNHFLAMLKTYKSKCTESWANEQVYLALGFAMAACAELEIDSCAIGGFEPEKYDKMLNLPPHIKSSVVLPIGYRQDDPIRPKVRKTKSQLFEWK